MNMGPRHIQITLLCFTTAVSFGSDTKVSSSLMCKRDDQRRVNRWEKMHTEYLSNIKLAVLPLGSVENHGPHLPLGTDLLIAEAICEQALLDMSTAAMLPPSPYGASFEHHNKPGTLAVKDAYLNGLWDNILSSLIKSGTNKVLLVNAHGGQTPNVDIAIRQFRFRNRALAVSFNVQAAFTEAWKNVEKRKELLREEETYGIHGGLIETSVMLHLYPELVEMTQAKNFKPRRKFEHCHLQPHSAVVAFGWRSEDLSEWGAVGNARMASTALGAAIFKHAVDTLRRLVYEVLKTDNADILEAGV